MYWGVCVRVCLYVYINTHIHIYIYTYIHIHIYILLYTDVCIDQLALVTIHTRASTCQSLEVPILDRTTMGTWQRESKHSHANKLMMMTVSMGQRTMPVLQDKSTVGIMTQRLANSKSNAGHNISSDGLIMPNSTALLREPAGFLELATNAGSGRASKISPGDLWCQFWGAPQFRTTPIWFWPSDALKNSAIAHWRRIFFHLNKSIKSIAEALYLGFSENRGP